MTLVRQEKATNPNNLLIDCGDTLQDNSADLFNAKDVHPMIQAMNLMGYDAWTLGNHEFNFGMDFLNKNIAGFEGDVLSANIYKEGTEERFVEPYAIYEIEGVRVAVVGMIPPHIPVWEASTPEHFDGLEFMPVVEETKKVIEELEGKYDVLVGAYHIGPEGEHGYDGLDVVAENCSEFDVLFGGHAHAKYTNEINGVKIIERGKYGWALAKADITVTKEDGAYVVSEVVTENLETYEVKPDTEITEAFAYVHEASLADASTVVGQITADFIARPDYITGESDITTMPTSQLQDSAVIDLINEVQMYYSEAEVGSAALFNFGSNLVAGDFMKKDVAFIYKYDNTLIGVNITGANLKEYMEWSASYYNTYKAGDLTISFNPDIRGYNYDMFSGIDYKIDISKEAGNRIINPKINGEPIDDEAVYKLAVNNYRFGTIMNLGLVTEEDKYYDSYELMQDAGRIRALIIQYTQEVKGGVLEPTVDNNWEIIGEDIDSNPYKDEVYAMIADGDIMIPTSEDGRTLNVEAVNVTDLIADGVLDELNALDDPNLIYPGQKIYLP